MKNLIKFNPYFKKISYISGWIKYDIYKKNLNIFSSEINDIKKKFNNYYLFSSNYGALSEPGLTKRLKKNSNLVKYKNSKNKNNDYFTFKQSISDFKYLKKNLGNFLKLNPDINLIIRPHPADQLSSDWNYFKKFSNVAIISKFDIVPWIIASKGLIHRGCSTAIDATLLNKPTYYFLPGRKVLKSEKNLVYQISKKIKNFNHLKRYNFETNSEKLKILNKEIEKKEPAYNKIISQFNKMKIKKENPVRFSFFEQCMNYSIPFVGNIKLRLISLMRFQK